MFHTSHSSPKSFTVMPPELISVSTLLNRFKQKRHFVEGKSVAFETDVADLYGITTRRLKQIVQRHKPRFPADFLFKASDGRYVFTEEGILMLSSVLKNAQAVQISLDIIRELFGFNAN